jgi:hypothetical protein
MNVTCPVPGCTGTTHVGQMLCKPHWMKVPSDIKNEVLITWRTLRYRLGPLPRVQLDEYLAARQSAIKAAQEPDDACA